MEGGVRPRRKPPPLWAHQVPDHLRSAPAGARPEPEPEPQGADGWVQPPVARLTLAEVPRERTGARRKPPPLWAHHVPGSSYPVQVAAQPDVPVAEAPKPLSPKRVVPRAVSPKHHRRAPQRAAGAQRPGEQSDDAPTDREAELRWWWDEEVRQQADRLNLISASVLHDFFALERDRTVHFSGECTEMLPPSAASGGRSQQRRFVMVVSKRALYTMHIPMPAAGQQWRTISPRLLLRNVTAMRVWSQSDEQLAIEYQQPNGGTARRMLVVSEGRRDQAIGAIQTALRLGRRREVPVHVSSRALFSPPEIRARVAEQPTRGFTKSTYGDNAVREGDESAELCFTTLIGMVSVLSRGIFDTRAHVSTAPTPEQFTEAAKEVFPAAGTASTPPHAYRSFEFTTYAPQIFRRIRSLAGVSEHQYLLRNMVTFSSFR